MGLQNREGGKFITILNGKFAVRVPEGTKGAVSRVNKVNKTVHELFYDSFTAKLINIRTRVGTYGKTWEFDFRDNGEVYTLQLSYANSYAKNLLKILPNADLSKEMKIQPSQKIEDGKTKSSLFVSQDGVTLKHAYTKDKRNGLPDMKKVMVNGVEGWDDSEGLAFLEEMVEKTLLPKLPKDFVATAGSEDGEPEEKETVSPDGDDDF